MKRKYFAVLATVGLLSALGSAALAEPSQPPQGNGAPVSGTTNGAPIFNSNPDDMGRYLDLCGSTAVSAWAGTKSDGHANVGNPANPNGNQPGGGCGPS